MIHTFEIYSYIGIRKAYRILNYLNVNLKEMNSFNGNVNVNGIARLSVLVRGSLEKGYLLKVIVNPAKLLYGYDTFDVVPANSEVLQQMTTAFTAAMEEATGETWLKTLPEWYVKRIDYAVDISTSYVKQYVKLLNKGDKPKAYKDKAKGRDGSCSWGCNSITGNVYDKADQMSKRGKPQEMIERARNILRFEVQCSSPKVGYIRKAGDFESRKLQYFFLPAISEDILLNYCRRVYKIGNYYSLRAAQAHMKQLGISSRREIACQILLRVIAQITTVSDARVKINEGIILENTRPKAKLKYSKEQFSRNLRHLAELNINPVTIPREWRISFLPGLYSLLEDGFLASANLDGNMSA